MERRLDWLPLPVKYVANQVFPTPAPLDILMDLAAHSSSFLQVSLSNTCQTLVLQILHLGDSFHFQGVAHAGLGAGAERLTRTAIPKVSDVLSRHPDYDVLITGYSLGAGEKDLDKMIKLFRSRAAGCSQTGGGTTSPLSNQSYSHRYN